MPFGTAMRRIFFWSSPSILKIQERTYCTGLFSEKQNIVMRTAESVREMSEGQATPSTPACSRKTPMQLPTTFTMLETIEIYIVVLALPKLR